MIQERIISISEIKAAIQERLLPFFPWPNAHQGTIGDGQVGVTSYVVPTGALPYWENRLAKFNIPFKKAERFGEQYLTFDDTHGLHLEIVEREEGEKNEWKFGDVTPDVAIKGFGGATLFSTQPEKTAVMLENVMGLEQVGKEGDLIRFRSSSDIGNIIDLKLASSGTGKWVPELFIISLGVQIDDADQLDWKTHVEGHGYGVTAVRDRNYFKAIYFKEAWRNFV